MTHLLYPGPRGRPHGKTVPSVYTRMSPMHDHLRHDVAVADDFLRVAFDAVDHRTLDQSLGENRLIAMASTPTRVYDRASGEPLAEVDVWDYFDFEPLGPRRTRLAQTVVPDMKSPVQAF